MIQFLVASLLLSLLLTMVLNLLLRVPGVQQWLDARLDAVMAARPERNGPTRSDDGPRVRVFVPWKAMLIGSIVLTILVNAIGAIG
ncbi:MAG: hypothetical protein OEV40_21170 [Acidimicrobiia bacterium]|nr:hypothetical protein [Acidimicrobiia bacterium]